VKLELPMNERLRKNWGPLAEMHLLLREHGWKPRYRKPGEVHPQECWEWTRPGCRARIRTVIPYHWRLVRMAGGRRWRAFWIEFKSRRSLLNYRSSYSVPRLRKRLKDLAQGA
jgi:hypothetical protein